MTSLQEAINTGSEQCLRTLYLKPRAGGPALYHDHVPELSLQLTKLAPKRRRLFSRGASQILRWPITNAVHEADLIRSVLNLVKASDIQWPSRRNRSREAGQLRMGRSITLDGCHLTRPLWSGWGPSCPSLSRALVDALESLNVAHVGLKGHCSGLFDVCLDGYTADSAS